VSALSLHIESTDSMINPAWDFLCWCKDLWPLFCPLNYCKSSNEDLTTQINYVRVVSLPDSAVILDPSSIQGTEIFTYAPSISDLSLWNDDYGGKGEELGKEPNYAVTQLANNCNEIH